MLTAWELFDSWKGEEIVADQTSGHFLSTPGAGVFDHHDDQFHISGRFNVPRGPLGRPVILQAGTLGQKIPAAEILPGKGVPRRHHIPSRPPPGEMIQAGKLPRYFVRLVEGGVDGAGEAQAIGNSGQRSQDDEGVRAANHVQVIDLPTLLAKTQSFGEEEEVEAGSLRRAGHVGEGAELDLTP